MARRAGLDAAAKATVPRAAGALAVLADGYSWPTVTCVALMAM